MHHLRRVLPYVRPYWQVAAASVTFTVLAALIGLLAPWPLTILIDNVLGNNPLPVLLQPLFGARTPDRVALLLLAVLSGLVITLLGGGLNVLSEYVNTWLEQRIVLDFRSDLFKHAERLSVAHADRVSSMRLMYGINFEAASSGSLIMALQPLVQSGLTLIGMTWISFQIDPMLALLSLTVVPFLYYSVGYYSKHIQSRLLYVKGMEADSLSIVHEAMQMLRVVVAFGREHFEYSRFRHQGGRTIDARVKVTVQQTLFSLVINMTTAAGTALVLGLGAYHALQGQLTAGELLVVMSYIGSVYKPLEAISYTIGSLQDKFTGLTMAFSVLDTVPEIQQAPDAIRVGRAQGNITFQQVCFNYPGRHDTLKDISFETTAGQVIALVGPTGAGKTTLMSLIPRFYDPASGCVRLDGIDLRQLTLESLRNQISIVLQEPVLFSGSIADNIRYGRLDATEDEIVEAAKAANAHEFIMRLPNGYRSTVGERGVQLSGGERQRICVARAFIKNAPILILDEPTSSIDSKTEAVILDALDRLMAGRTTFMIAHRLSTIRHADLILVLNEGKLVGKGTHEELLQNNELYRQLHEIQAGQTRKRHRLLPMLEESSPPAQIPAVPPAEPPERSAELQREARMAATPTVPLKKIVILGMMSRHPEPGVVWQTLHYVIGLQRLGYDVYYVEAHGVTPNRLIQDPSEDSSFRAAAFIARIMRRVDLNDHWAFHALHADGKCYGLSEAQLQDLYQSADLIINLHGGTAPRPEHYKTGRLVFLETDPVELEIELFNNRKETIDFLAPHSAFFTFGENYGQPDCRLPVSDRFAFKPTRQPVVLDWWQAPRVAAEFFTTVGNWQQKGRHVVYQGETYTWSKHYEFLKFLDLPQHAPQEFELALSGCSDGDRHMLETCGWRVIPAESVCTDLDSYRAYIQSSRGEFTVAKDQNVRLRSGWFSDRSATYLAAGKPVITQDTGFGNILPTGVGLFGFTGMDEIVKAIEAINSDYERHSRAALEIAHGYFDHEVVLTHLLSELGMQPQVPRRSSTQPSRPMPAWPGQPLAPQDFQVRLQAVLPAEMPAGGLIELDCVIANLGRAPMATARPFPTHISYKWLDPQTGQRLAGIEGLRTGLPEPLGPFESRPFRVQIQAPEITGEFALHLTLVQENVAWFDDLSPDNASCGLVRVGQATLARELALVISDHVEVGS